MRRWGATVVVLAAVLSAACGQKAPGSDAAAGTLLPGQTSTTSSAQSGADAPSDGSEPAGGGDSPTTTPPSGSAPAGAQPSTSPTTAAPNASVNKTPNRPIVPITVEAPACVKAGMPFNATVVGEPRSVVAMAMRFSDGKNYKQTRTGDADGSGRFTATFEVPLEAPDGEAQLFAAANAETGQGSVEHKLKVVRPTGRCP